MRVEEEGPDYRERYAPIMMHREHLALLIEQYHGEIAVHAVIMAQEI
jgi:hypothetical protein